MKKIASFTVNHLNLLRGIYVSRRDVMPLGDEVTTFDIRMTEPNRMEPLDGAVLHTIEHLAATLLRNHPQWADSVIYWGPMGCRTGNYLLMKGHLEPADIVPLMREVFGQIARWEGDVPGAAPRDCGNYSYMDLEGARREAGRYLDEVLSDIRQENMNYPE